MPFDIHQRVFDDETGEYLEEEAQQYQNQLVRLFKASPEGQQLGDEAIEASWTVPFLEFAMQYVGVTPPQMSAASLREILFELFPRKVSTESEAAPEIIRELRLFWTFLQREFHLENAAECLKVLNSQAERRLQKELANPANYGMAKSIVMMGAQRGFNMTTEKGIEEWIKTYNAEREASPGSPFSPPGFPFPSPGRQHTGVGKSYASDRKRKMAKLNQKRNRSKK